MDEIKITKDMKFELYNLMSYVDAEHEFTLRDVLCACKNSIVPMSLLEELLQCPYIEDYYNEMDKGEKDNDRAMKYLELGYTIEHDDDPSVSQGWSFYGMGEEGDIPQDIIDHYSEEEVQKMRDEGFAQSYAVEFTPIYDLADYVIKIGNKIHITDWQDLDDKRVIKGQPLIRLIDVLYEIFWELSSLGGPEDRDEKKEKLRQRLDSYEKDKEGGTLKFVDFEEVKAKFNKKYDLDI